VRRGRDRVGGEASTMEGTESEGRKNLLYRQARVHTSGRDGIDTGIANYLLLCAEMGDCIRGSTSN